jgi:hypothetical protein
MGVENLVEIGNRLSDHPEEVERRNKQCEEGVMRKASGLDF